MNCPATTGRHFLYNFMQLTHRCKNFTHFTTRMCVWLLYHLFSSWVDRQRDISRTFTQILALKFIKLCFCQIPRVPFAWVSHVLFDCEITCFRVSCMRAHLKFERSATLMLDDHDIKYTSLGWGWPSLRVLQLRISVFAWRCTVAGIGVVDNMAAVA